MARTKLPRKPSSEATIVRLRPRVAGAPVPSPAPSTTTRSVEGPAFDVSPNSVGGSRKISSARSTTTAIKDHEEERKARNRAHQAAYRARNSAAVRLTHLARIEELEQEVGELRMGKWGEELEKLQLVEAECGGLRERVRELEVLLADMVVKADEARTGMDLRVQGGLDFRWSEHLVGHAKLKVKDAV